MQFRTLLKAIPSLLMALIAMLAGTPLQAATAWAPPTTVSGDLSNLSPGTQDGRVGIAPNGNAVAIWVEADITGVSAIHGATFDGTNWTPTSILSNPLLGFASEPSLAVDSSGNAIAVWQLVDVLGNFYIQGAVLPVGTLNWIPTTDLSPASMTVKLFPQVAFDGAGNAIGVWSEGPLGNRRVFGAKLTAGSFIWVPTTIVSNAGLTSGLPFLAVNSNGDAVTIWDSTASPVSHAILGATLPAGSFIWNAPSQVSPTSVNTFGISHQLGIDSAGNAIAIWRMFDGTNSFVQSARLPSGGSIWQLLPDLATEVGNNLFTPSIAVSPNGFSVSTWNRRNPIYSCQTVIQGAFLPTGAGAWIHTADLANDTSPPISLIVDTLKIDDAGNALKVYDLAGIVKSTTLLAGQTTWSTPLIVSILTDVSSVFDLALTPSGKNAVTIWEDNTQQVMQVSTLTNVFLPPPPSPPSNLVAKIFKNKFLLQTESFIRLTWTASSDLTVTSYNILRNGVLIGTVSASGPLVFDVPRCRKKTVTFSVVAVNAGGESTAITVTVP